ncbi:hypothetical protein EIP91_004894 [Steccherinum ochraceum]|uniref:VWFA domain-containing protein n=1 Tax=Steccherinum ochraceum TaxID=92696 RepID=A0A4V2MVT7_9APHY|nr:hypothetical protein EIP91_004894 [Steccherinum ochraceum]
MAHQASDTLLRPPAEAEDTHELRTVSSNASFRSAAEDFHPEVEREHESSVFDASEGDAYGQRDYRDSDLATEIKGLYRILDLVNEQGSGGLVDKIVISQESLEKFMNDIRPGSYKSMTRIDFSALDSVLVRPQGIYGSRSEIVRFLGDLGVIDVPTAGLLRNCRDAYSVHASSRTMRSGLYMLRVSAESPVYVIYWPEDTTWNYNASSSAQKNRVTFMRQVYLTKITDQIVALISDVHASAIQWNDPAQDVSVEVDDDEIDRLFSFQVEKTNEKEEQAAARAGFTMELTKKKGKTREECPPGVDARALLPRLVPGETMCGVLEVKATRSRMSSTPMKDLFTEVRIKTFLRDKSFRLSFSLSDAALQNLFLLGLGTTRAFDITASYQTQRSAAFKSYTETKNKRVDDFKRQQAELHELLNAALQDAIANAIHDKFNTLDPAKLTGKTADKERYEKQQEHLQQLLGSQPDFETRVNEVISRNRIKITSKEFKDDKSLILAVEAALRAKPGVSEDEQDRIIWSVMGGPTPEKAERKGGFFRSWVQSAASILPGGQSKESVVARDMSDTDFLDRLDVLSTDYPILDPLILSCTDRAYAALSAMVRTQSHALTRDAEDIQIENFVKRVEKDLNTRLQAETDALRKDYLQAVENSFITEPKYFTLVNDVWPEKSSSYWNILCDIEKRSDATLQHTIHPLMLSEDDRQDLQTDPSFVPTPRILTSNSFDFPLPLDHRVLHIQILEESRCLLVTETAFGSVRVFLERWQDLGAAVQNDRPKKILHREKIGRDSLLAYDENERMLAVCASQKLSLHVFVFDELYTVLQGFGSAVELKPWYEGHTQLIHMAFVCGSNEELVFVDDVGMARVYSLTTQQFRPASIRFQRTPSQISSSPDGACLLSAEYDSAGLHLRAYHWSNFGATDGIRLDVPDLPRDSRIITSFGNRSQMHYIGLDMEARRCKSFALDITRRVTEFMFKEKGGTKARLAGGGNVSSTHNSLVDCFADVWTRFPVVPAVRRNTVKADGGRRPTSITFVCNLESSSFQSHFDDLVTQFERTTRKPTDSKLAQIRIKASPYEQFISKSYGLDLSELRAGEWLVDILCLIPIHIAVTRDNRFIPLKDGVWSSQLERTLLGATVSQIVDSLTFGWYESIFESYMASKPVRVVSSMGEQSVGKSFALNHLVDTSFAGSAMRTTEGVWMSVTPTEESLIVALDFEGVHSIERSAQEDTLLVLFNTALSNLVLFRNNFAISRDIAGLFQSFQSSSTVLDPAANPTLFKSMLDVVESDKTEITKEFRLKFQKIVEVEQGSNFISRLHGGSLSIIPWPVIESRQFYTLFPALKKILDKQEVTHRNASIFLQTMKTLMAKLKANDWGALDQNLASHRAQQLLGMLPPVSYNGDRRTYSQDIDSGAPIGSPDTDSPFYLSEAGDVEVVLSEKRAKYLEILLGATIQDDRRFDGRQGQWTKDTQESLDLLATLRVEHVREWIDVNVSRFAQDSSQLQEPSEPTSSFVDCSVLLVNSHVSRPTTTMVHTTAALRIVALILATTLRIMGVIMRSKIADSPPDMPKTIYAISPRICVVTSAISSAGPAVWRDVPNPLGMKMTHICVRQSIISAVNHAVCRISVYTMVQSTAVQAVAKFQFMILIMFMNARSNPAQSNVNYARGFAPMLTIYMHCPRAPQSIFADKTIRVTRYASNAAFVRSKLHRSLWKQPLPGGIRLFSTPSIRKVPLIPDTCTISSIDGVAVSKRLPCVVRILPGETSHGGDHVHSSERKPFHYCETRCEDCGYFCMLPLGHPQQEHETSHGSMSRTKWAIEGPEGTKVEVNGRQFGSRDDGAPMLCNMLCMDMGRHIHIDYCRSETADTCSGTDLVHIDAPVSPNPARPKDYISHALYWRRLGFKDPYSHDDQDTFKKCCKNPAQLQPAFHVIFVVDRLVFLSLSMGKSDRKPLPNTPVTARLVKRHNNRLGAVYSSLHGFWVARNAAVNPGTGPMIGRRDAYSIIFFDRNVDTSLENDFSSTPEQLTTHVLSYRTGRGTNFTQALDTARIVMDRNWSLERSPVIIFLSDGQAQVADNTVRDLCNRAVARGRPVSLHTVAFGPRNQVLRRMAHIAGEVENRAPADPMHPLVASSYTEALDTIRLAETFLGFAESLRKPRGALMHG